MTDMKTKVTITTTELLLLREHLQSPAQREEEYASKCAQEQAELEEAMAKLETDLDWVDRQEKELLRAGHDPASSRYQADDERASIYASQAALKEAAAARVLEFAPKDPLDPLPERIEALSDELKRLIASVVVKDGEGWRLSKDVLKWVSASDATDLPRHIQASIIRGEREFQGLPIGSDGFGYLPNGTLYTEHVADALELTFVCDTNPKHWLIAARDNHNPLYLTNAVGGRGEPIIPPSHRKHSLADLAPSSRSPIPVQQQAAVFDILKALPLDLRGLMMIGPPGGGKTTYAAVLVKDTATLRLADAQKQKGTDVEHELCIWRIRADEWIEAVYMWKHRDWDDKSVREPAVTIASIREACNRTGLRPIIWVEEIDKLQPTKKQLAIFNSLIDSVYELEGLIIATGNGSLESLTEALGEATTRRITGEYDNPDLFMTLDFNKLTRAR